MQLIIKGPNWKTKEYGCEKKALRIKIIIKTARKY